MFVVNLVICTSVFVYVISGFIYMHMVYKYLCVFIYIYEYIDMSICNTYYYICIHMWLFILIFFLSFFSTICFTFNVSPMIAVLCVTVIQFFFVCFLYLGQTFLIPLFINFFFSV